jgi:hypothetical protein
MKDFKTELRKILDFEDREGDRMSSYVNFEKWIDQLYQLHLEGVREERVRTIKEIIKGVKAMELVRVGGVFNGDEPIRLGTDKIVEDNLKKQMIKILNQLAKLNPEVSK